MINPVNIRASFDKKGQKTIVFSNNLGSVTARPESYQMLKPWSSNSEKMLVQGLSERLMNLNEEHPSFICTMKTFKEKGQEAKVIRRNELSGDGFGCLTLVETARGTFLEAYGNFFSLPLQA